MNNLLLKISSPVKIRMNDRNYKLECLISELEDKLNNKNRINYDNDNACIFLKHENYSKDIRDEIANLYVQKGWSKVEHMTSSENGERPGLTEFKFYW